MNVTTHERPGVYSVYGASSLVRGSGGRKTVGLAAVNTKAEAGVIQTITSYEEAVSTFGSQADSQDMAELIRVILLNGAAAVVAVPVANAEGYEAAFAALSGMEDLSVVVCDSTDQEVQQKLRDSVTAASAARRERIAVVAGGAEESVTALTDRAKALNSERVVLAAPGGVSEKGTALSGLTAAAVAGAIAGQGDPAVPLGGAELLGLNGLSAQYGDNDIDLLVRGGVTPLDSRAGTVSVVRGITTRTRSGESEDATWRELSTVLIVDDVIPAIRESLRARFRRAKNTEQSRGAIRSQVVLELENKKAREIITGYDGVTVTALPENPTVCLVEFAFTVAHGLNQIWLTASITI